MPPGCSQLPNHPLFPGRRDGGGGVTVEVMGSLQEVRGWLEVLDGQGSSRAAEQERMMDLSPAV